MSNSQCFCFSKSWLWKIMEMHKDRLQKITWHWLFPLPEVPQLPWQVTSCLLSHPSYLSLNTLGPLSKSGPLHCPHDTLTRVPSINLSSGSPFRITLKALKVRWSDFISWNPTNLCLTPSAPVSPAFPLLLSPTQHPHSWDCARPSAWTTCLQVSPRSSLRSLL